MPRGPRAFKQRDVTRVMRAVKAAGVDIGRVEVDLATGKIVIVTNACSREQVSDLDKWTATHARSS
jgi:hypothetical protein